MTGSRWRAPGKLVLVGEYAVLDGAGAVVAAVDRGVECRVEPGLGVVTPGDGRFVRAALEGAPPARYVFSDWNPVMGIAGKPGFGGSAAATVVATLAAGHPGARAFAVHAAVQGGGSGVDIFASLHGGVRRFPDGAPVRAAPLVAVWSGRSAATGPRVIRYLAWPERERFVAASAALVDAFGEDPIGVVAEAYRRLVEMGAAAGVDYDTPEHAAIAALARAYGGAAKPSGAGGGDVAVALFADEGALADFTGACAAAGHVPIPIRIANAAGRVDPPDGP